MLLFQTEKRKGDECICYDLLFGGSEMGYERDVHEYDFLCFFLVVYRSFIVVRWGVDCGMCNMLRN